jgi:hypothetical protein
VAIWADGDLTEAAVTVTAVGTTVTIAAGTTVTIAAGTTAVGIADECMAS